MAGRTANALLLGDDERAELEALTRATSVSAGVAARARIVLLAADATPNHQIAELVGVSRPTVNKWRERFSEHGWRVWSMWPVPGRSGGSIRGGSWRRR